MNDETIRAVLRGGGINARSYRECKLLVTADEADEYDIGQFVILTDEIGAGIYDAPQNFADDTVGSAPSGWTDDDGGLADSIIVAGPVDGHANVLRQHDLNGSGSCNVNYDWGSPTADNVVEFWWAKASVAANTTSYVDLYEGGTGGTQCVRLKFDTAAISSWDGSTWNSVTTGLSADTFYHVKLVLDDSANTFDCHVDGTNEGTFDYDNNSTTGVDTIRLITDSSDDDFIVYFDAIGVNGVDDYEAGDNWRHGDYVFMGYVVEKDKQDTGWVKIKLEGIDRELHDKATAKTVTSAEQVNDVVREIIDETFTNLWYDDESIPSATGTSIIYDANASRSGDDIATLANVDDKIFHVYPDGKCHLLATSGVGNNGGASYDEADDNLFSVLEEEIDKRVNRVVVYGQTTSAGRMKVVEEDTGLQATMGEVVELVTYAPHLKSYTEMQAVADTLLTRFKDTLTVYEVTLQDTIAVKTGETINVTWTGTDLTLSGVDLIVIEVKEHDLLTGVHELVCSEYLYETFTRASRDDATAGAFHRPDEEDTTSDPSATTLEPESVEDLRKCQYRERTSETQALKLIYDSTHEVAAWVDSGGNLHLKPDGNVDVESVKISSVTDPTSAQDAATKNYVDTNFSPTGHDHDATYLNQSLNLSDLPSTSSARSNLELGTLATQDSVDISDDTNLGAGTGLTLSGDTLNWAAAINDLSDVDVSGPANDEVLTYNSSTSQWEANPTAGFNGDLDGNILTDNSGSDVIINAQSGYDVRFKYDGGTVAYADGSGLSLATNVDINFDGGDITSNGYINFKADSDTDDYLRVHTVSDKVYLQFVNCAGEIDAAGILELQPTGDLQFNAGGDVDLRGNELTDKTGDVNINAQTGQDINFNYNGSIKMWVDTHVKLASDAHLYLGGGIGSKLMSTSGDLVIDPNGNVNINNNKITNLSDPTNNQDAATKAYVDANAENFNGDLDGDNLTDGSGRHTVITATSGYDVLLGMGMGTGTSGYSLAVDSNVKLASDAHLYLGGGSGSKIMSTSGDLVLDPDGDVDINGNNISDNTASVKFGLEGYHARILGTGSGTSNYAYLEFCKSNGDVAGYVGEASAVNSNLKLYSEANFEVVCASECEFRITSHCHVELDNTNGSGWWISPRDDDDITWGLGSDTNTFGSGAKQMHLENSGDLLIRGSLSENQCYDLRSRDVLGIIADIFSDCDIDAADAWGHPKFNLARLHDAYPWLVSKKETHEGRWDETENWEELPLDYEALTNTEITQKQTMYFEKLGYKSDLALAAIDAQQAEIEHLQAENALQAQTISALEGRIETIENALKETEGVK